MAFSQIDHVVSSEVLAEFLCIAQVVLGHQLQKELHSPCIALWGRMGFKPITTTGDRLNISMICSVCEIY